MTTKHRIEAFAYSKRGELLALGENSYAKTHPAQAMFAKAVGLDAKQYLHAEMAALLRSRGKRVHTLHVFRRNKAGKLMNAKPCLVCQAAIKAYGVAKVYYSDSNGEIVML